MLFATFRAEKRFDPRDLIRKTAVRISFFTCVILFETTTLPGQNFYYFCRFVAGPRFHGPLGIETQGAQLVLIFTMTSGGYGTWQKET